MNACYREKVISKAVILTGSVYLIFWTVCFLINGEVSCTNICYENQWQIINWLKIPNFLTSRWLDILAGPLIAYILSSIFTNSRIVACKKFWEKGFFEQFKAFFAGLFVIMMVIAFSGSFKLFLLSVAVLSLMALYFIEFLGPFIAFIIFPFAGLLFGISSETVDLDHLFVLFVVTAILSLTATIAGLTRAISDDADREDVVLNSFISGFMGLNFALGFGFVHSLTLGLIIGIPAIVVGTTSAYLIAKIFFTVVLPPGERIYSK